MRFLLLMMSAMSLSFAQTDQTRSTIEVVEVLNGNTAEALYYFENNWKQLRIQAVKEGYIRDFQLLVQKQAEGPDHILLITTFFNQDQYDNREENFKLLIGRMDGLKLMNAKKPRNFRKRLTVYEAARRY